MHSNLFFNSSSNYRISRPIRRTMIFSWGILEKKYDECILILVIYLKKTGLLHILLQESKPFTSSDARSHNLEANFTISRQRCYIIAVRVFISLEIILTLGA
jgi:hypothetical protein